MTPAEFIDDPNWAEFLPEMRQASKKRTLPTHEDCSRLDVEAAERHLRSGGTLGRMPGYEERQGQLDMLGAVVRAFNAREHLMVEAGTGVGKSLAYLVPSMLWARTNDTPVVVSTATRNLQSQLIGSDIPKALAVLGEAAADFKVALLKGRTNYLCLRELADFFSAGFWTMSQEEQDEMPHFIDWLRTTPDGDLDRYEGLPRNLLTCPGEECGGRRCPYYSRCFVYRARKAASEAHLVVANHALVLAEAVSGGGTVLPAYGRLVLDEAHNLEPIATEYLSREFSEPALTRILNRLVRKGKGRRRAAGGVLSAVERQLQKGVLAGNPAADAVRRRLEEASGRIVRIVSAAEDLVDLAGLLLKPAPKGRETVRYRVTVAENGAGVRAHSVRGLFEAYAAEDWDEDSLLAAESRFESEMAALVAILHGLRDALEGSAPENEFNYCSDLAAQVGGVAEGLVAFANEAHFVLKGEKPTHAYWVERVRLERRRSYIRLVAAPLSVADDLRRLLYEPKDSVILSSATLRVGNDFRYMARRLGFADPPGAAPAEAPRYRTLVAASPFDYLRQATVLAPDCLPDPAADPARYAGGLAPVLRDIVSATDGRALVLFTSYEMMNAVAAEARAAFAADGITLLVQGEGLSRESMTQALRSSAGSRTAPTVLFGAQSFWEGVDVAGEALSCVVIARLPFAQVGDPVVEARSEKIDRDGGSSFRDYALPEAVIRFRQGFGRLVRSKRDRGIVIVTDPRLVTKPYGAIFRRSIPASVHTITGADELVGRIRSFFAAE